MNRIFTNYFCEINEALHISAFFDPWYKNLAYGNISQNDILLPIKRVIVNYKNSDIILPSQTSIQTSRQLTNLSASKTRFYFHTLLMPDQISQPVANELDIYFNSNPSGDEIVPLEWWKTYAIEYLILSKMA